MYENIRLITIDEDKSLFLKQEKILQKFENEKNSDDIIRLALLQTLPMIVDYDEAVKILEAAAHDFEDVKMKLIGAYLSSTFVFDRENYYLKDLNNKIGRYEANIQAMIYYLNAYNIWVQGLSEGKEEYIQEQLNKSIELDKSLVSSYHLLSEFSSKKEKRRLLSIAKTNVKRVLSMEDYEAMQIDGLIDPNHFINEFIKETYRSYIHYPDLL
jgi:hypothetical protein